MTVLLLVAWQKPRTRMNAITGQVPPQTVLFDFQNLVDKSLIKTDGAAVYQLAGRLRIGVANPGDGAPSAFLLPRHGHWDLSRYRYLEVDVHNVGRMPASVSVFAFVPGGFGGISTYPQHENGRELLRPGAQHTLRIDLHQRFPDNTETIDPRNITQLRIVLNNGVHGTMIDVLRVRAIGQGPAERHDFPGPAGRSRTVTEGLPGPGKRVYMTLEGSPVRYVLYLPKDWSPDGSFPIIAEYSGNIFYFKNTYSTGKADEGNIGYGMSKGSGAIWVNLPFLSPDRTHEQLDGFGNLDATAEYARKVIREVVEKYSGDSGAVFLTGFSRGGAACGFIGLRNNETRGCLAGLSRGQRRRWRGLVRLRDAGSDRAGRTDERPVVIHHGRCAVAGCPGASSKQPFTYMDSGIGAHVDTMFLDNRPSTLAVRKWMADVLKNRPGVHDISGTVLDAEGMPVEGARVESGYTHLTLTDQRGQVHPPQPD